MTQEAQKVATKEKTATPKTKVAKKKVAAKIKAKPQAKAPVVNPHIEAGVDPSAYKGLSSFINKSRKTEIMLGVERPSGKLTERMQKALYAMRSAYGTKGFDAKGLDNGVLRDLNAAGLIKCDGGQKQTIDGKPYLTDGATPVKVHVTSAGMNYGKA